MVAAICSDPYQTLQSAREVLTALSGEIEPNFQPAAMPDERAPASPTSSASAVDSAGYDKRPKTRPSKAKFSGKLTSNNGSITASDFASTSSLQNTAETLVQGSSSGTSSSDTTPIDEGQVEEILEEWDHQQKNGVQPALDGEQEHSLDDPHFQLTDEEDDVSSESQHDGLASNNAVDAEKDPLQFLQHAFPSRSLDFLMQILFGDCDGDFAKALDTLFAIDLAESDAIEASTAASSSSSSSHTYDSGPFGGTEGSTGGLDDDHLEHGVWQSTLKGKKRKAARKRINEQERRRKAGFGNPADHSDPTMITLRNDAAAAGKKITTTQNKISLTDVRHGGLRRDIPMTRPKAAPRFAVRGDEDFTRRIGEIEAKLEGQAKAGAGTGNNALVIDNNWLLSSSVLAQLSFLLDLDTQQTTSAYYASGFNLALCFNRLVSASAETYSSNGDISDLDRAGSAPAGTALSIASGIADLTSAPLQQVIQLFCATGGKQDATIDLLQLHSAICDAMNEMGQADHVPDLLDPLGRMNLAETKTEEITIPATQQPSSIKAGPIEGRFTKAEGFFPKVGEVPNGVVASSTRPGYAGAVSKLPSAARIQATRAAERRASEAVVLPASASRVDTPGDWTSVSRTNGGGSSAASRMASYEDYRVIAEEYRARRADALRNAAAAWRSSAGGSGTGGGGGGRGPAAQVRGGVAWYYADEARRLDVKARAWQMRAAEALVSHRRAERSLDVRRNDRNTIDLHGLTVHEALSVTKNCVNEWYARPSKPGMASGGYLPPLRIITGVGRHSPKNVAVIKPAVQKMLDREGWRCDVDHNQGVIVVRGVK